MNSNLELDLELESDIKNLKSMLNKYTTMLKKAKFNCLKSKKDIFERLDFVFFQFKNIYIKNNRRY